MYLECKTFCSNLKLQLINIQQISNNKKILHIN